MPEIGLTKVQAKCFDVICDAIDTVGIAPSHEELQSALGLKSKSGVSRILESLEQRGRIRRMPNRARAIEVVDGARVVNLNPEIRRAVTAYAHGHGIRVDTAVNELLRLQLGVL